MALVSPLSGLFGEFCAELAALRLRGELLVRDSSDVPASHQVVLASLDELELQVALAVRGCRACETVRLI